MEGLPTCHLPANPLFFQPPSLSPHFEESTASSAGPIPPGNWTKMSGRPCFAGWITQPSFSCPNPALEGLSTVPVTAPKLPGGTSWLLGRVFFHNGRCGAGGSPCRCLMVPPFPAAAVVISPVQHLQARSSSRVALKPPSFPQRLAKLLDVQSLPAGACWENKPLSFVCSQPLFKAHPMGRAGTA